MGRIRQMSPGEAESILKRYGFSKVSSKGNHRIFCSVTVLPDICTRSLAFLLNAGRLDAFSSRHLFGM